MAEPSALKAAAQASPDVVIVGTGATGGWAAKLLAEAGLRVLVLEAGPDIDPARKMNRPTWRDQFPPDHVPVRQKVQAEHPEFYHRNPELFVDDIDEPYTTAEGTDFRWLRARQIGGRTLTWGGTTLRISQVELEGPARDGYGDPWPYSYDDLESSFTEVERFHGVVGSTEGLSELPDGVFRSPCAMTPGEKLFKETVERRWPERHVIHGRGIPYWFEGTPPDPPWPPVAVSGATLAAAKATGRLTVVTRVIAHEVLIDPATGHARALVVKDVETGDEVEVAAKHFILAGGTVETLRILLASESRQHPGGLGNGSGNLGRYIMDHIHTVVRSVAPSLPGLREPRPMRGPESILIPRFVNVKKTDRDYVGGFGVWGGVQRSLMPVPVPEGEPLPPSVIFLLGYGEVVARYENRVTLSTQRDVYGHRVPHFDCRFSDNEKKMVADMNSELGAMAQSIGGQWSGAGDRPLPVFGVFIHEVGGARTGADKARSVVDPEHRLWDSPNVLVIDGASWPSSAWQNPTLTMMAVAVRACHRFLDRLKSA